MDLTNAQLARSQRLLQTHVVDQQDFDIAQANYRQAQAQLPHEFHGRHGFANGNGVQPNGAGDGLSKGGGQEAAALPQGSEVGGQAQAAPQEIQQNKGPAKRLKEAVE